MNYLPRKVGVLRTLGDVVAKLIEQRSLEHVTRSSVFPFRHERDN